MAKKKVRLCISEVAPSLGQYKPLGIRLSNPDNRVWVEFEVPEKEVVSQISSGETVLTPDGLATIAGDMAQVDWKTIKYTKKLLGGKD